MKKLFFRRITPFVLASIFSVSLMGCNNDKLEKQPGNVTPKVTVETTNAGKVASGTEVAANTDKTGNSGTGSPFKNQDKKRVKAKALYLTGTSAGSALKKYIEIAKNTGVNAYVIDYKEDGGDKDNNGNVINIKVDSKVPLAIESKGISVEYDAEKVTTQLRENGIYSIARIVVFKDPTLAKIRPDYVIKNKDGSVFIHNGLAWVSVYSKEVWQYNIDLAKEALSKGFDEVQFDYLRFPDLTKSMNEKIVFPGYDGKTKPQAVNAFLAEARKQMPDAILSGDIFAIVIEAKSDGEAIGQEFETVGENLDYICPMAYPSHYANGQIINNVAFASPDLDPYGIVKQTLLKAKTRMDAVKGHKPIIRTYIQDFTASWVKPHQSYSDAQVEQQIKAIQDAGYEEFILWDPMNQYNTAPIKK